MEGLPCPIVSKGFWKAVGLNTWSLSSHAWRPGESVYVCVCGSLSTSSPDARWDSENTRQLVSIMAAISWRGRRPVGNVLSSLQTSILPFPPLPLALSIFLSFPFQLCHFLWSLSPFPPHFNSYLNHSLPLSLSTARQIRSRSSSLPFPLFLLHLLSRHSVNQGARSRASLNGNTLRQIVHNCHGD